MSTKHLNDQRSTGVRPRYIHLGTDTEGGTHLYRTVDETIFAFDAAGRPEYRFDVDGIAIDAYVAHVTDCRGWAACHYAAGGIGALIADAVEGP